MTSMSEAMTAVHQAENEIVGGFNRLAGMIPPLALLHRQAWEFAGSSDAEATEHGKALFKHEQAIRDSLEEIRKRFRAIDAATRAASQAVEEADARRKRDRSRLKI
jgi:hypothetical protein